MKKEVIEEKTCENCRYFSQHYSKQGSKYGTVCCGHCLNVNVKKSRKNPFTTCEYWEDIIIKIEERKKSIEETLEYISVLLNDIAMILKDDTEQKKY